MAKLVTLQLLRAYKWAVSPIFPPACRYVPTCSEYAMEAVERYGTVRGGLMTLWRLLRCHPLARGGYDPVVKQPERSHVSQKTHPAICQGIPQDYTAHEQRSTSPSPVRGAI
ncbi:MAG: membrane protein insertion efficiency factor YidD [Candidatus Sulfotelmatobacter sp.]